MDGLDLTVESGARVALTGASGAGKSTLFRLLTRTVVPASGSVLIDGRELAGLSLGEVTQLRRRIGVIHQRGDLVDGSSALMNVGIGTLADQGSRAALALAARGPRGAVAGRCHAALASVEIGHLAHAPVRELSGGERQRVAVARLLVQRPQLILADEPTASIDARSATLVLDALQDLAHDCGATLLLATHDTGVARRLDRVVGLARGRLVLDASASGLAEHALHAVYDGPPELTGEAQR